MTRSNMQRLLSFSPDFQKGLFVFSAHDLMQASNDSAAPFLQEANFFWLTGLDEPGWLLILRDGKSILVAPNLSEVQLIFDGRYSFDIVKKITGVDEIQTLEEGTLLLAELAKQYEAVLTLGADPYEKHFDFVLNPAGSRLMKQLKKQFSEVRDCRPELAKLRAIKQQHELTAIQRAVDVTVEAFQEVRDRLPRLKSEYETEAEFTYRFRKVNAQHAYEPIVAAGANAVTLHYGKNKNKFVHGELVVIDIGARINGYAADITRTYAVGVPTDRQVAVHAAVEAAQKAIIDLLKPGLLVREYHEKVDEIMKSTLKLLGLYKKESDFRKYFPHAVSHGLGIDVHDALGRPEVFEPGMVITVEPGVYIPEEGIGVRIEDDILITETGHRNLSAGLSTSL